MDLENDLRRRVTGQEEAVAAVAKAIRRSRSPLKDPRRPGGSFIFLGPTGTGKTELAKTLAEYLFGSKDALISFDMSEFASQYEVSKLIGSPPGYVGHEEGGQLTKAVRRNPYSVVLFDEIEKAHPDIFNILLQVLDEGRLTDSQGKTVDFRNTVVIMTSNVGAREIAQDASVGFGTTGEAGLTADEIRGRAMGELKRLFRPEFINRVDDIVVFRKLQGESLTRIAELLVDDLRQRLIANGMNIVLTDEALAKIVREGTDLTSGDFDVVVCDGFAGNIALKSIEGAAKFMMEELKGGLMSSFKGKVAAVLMKPVLRSLKHKLSGDAKGGAVLLGLRGVVMIGHGATSVEAVKNGTLACAEAARQGLVERVASSMGLEA